MIGEVSLDGVFVPPLLLLASGAFALTLALRRVLRRLHAYRYIWHAGLFDVAMFAVALFVLAAATVPL